MSRTTISMSGPADEVLAEVLFRVASNLVEAEVNCKAVACQLEAKGMELAYKDVDAVDALRSLAAQIHEVCAEFLDEEIVGRIAKEVYGMEGDYEEDDRD